MVHFIKTKFYFAISSILLVFIIYILYLNINSLVYIPQKHTHANVNASPKLIISILKKITENKVNNLEFSREVVKLFHLGVRHYWSNHKHDLEINPKQNWSLALLSKYIFPHNVYSEFINYRYTIYRGVGLCSQNALAIDDFMKNEVGISSRVISLDGHVINESRFRNGDIFVLDGDYNVVLPFSIIKAKKNPEIVARIYREHGCDKKKAEYIAKLYANNEEKEYRGRYHLFILLTKIFNWTSFILLVFLASLSFKNIGK